MLHTKPQGHWPFGFGEEDFWRVFTIYGRGGHLGHVNPDPANKLSFPGPMDSIWNLASIGPVVLETFENGGPMDDGACLYCKLNNKPKGSGELKKLTTYGITASYKKLTTYGITASYKKLTT